MRFDASMQFLLLRQHHADLEKCKQESRSESEERLFDLARKWEKKSKEERKTQEELKNEVTAISSLTLRLCCCASKSRISR